MQVCVRTTDQRAIRQAGTRSGNATYRGNTYSTAVQAQGLLKCRRRCGTGKVQEKGRRSDVRSLRLLLASSRTVCAKRNVVLQALQRIATACATSNEKEWRGDWAGAAGRERTAACGGREGLGGRREDGWMDGWRWSGREGARGVWRSVSAVQQKPTCGQKEELVTGRRRKCEQAGRAAGRELRRCGQGEALGVALSSTALAPA